MIVVGRVKGIVGSLNQRESNGFFRFSLSIPINKNCKTVAAWGKDLILVGGDVTGTIYYKINTGVIG